mgnify:CR=1 FL=1
MRKTGSIWIINLLKFVEIFFWRPKHQDGASSQERALGWFIFLFLYCGVCEKPDPVSRFCLPIKFFELFLVSSCRCFGLSRKENCEG